MTALALIDLNASSNLDSAALADVQGSGMWHLRSRSTSMGNWSGYSFQWSNYQGITWHDGYLQKHYIQGWQRTRVETENTVWDKFVKL